jgi:hypothetical protein
MGGRPAGPGAGARTGRIPASALGRGPVGTGGPMRPSGPGTRGPGGPGAGRPGGPGAGRPGGGPGRPVKPSLTSDKQKPAEVLATTISQAATRPIPPA